MQPRPLRNAMLIGVMVVTSFLAVLLWPGSGEQFPTPGVIPQSKARPQLAVTWNAAVFLAPDGSLWNWGSTQYTSIILRNSTRPRRVGNDSDWVQISCEWLSFALGLKSDGSVWGWGATGSGQLCTTNNAIIREPVRIGSDKDWTRIRTGASHALALKKDGTLWGWGQNDRGQLADGTTENRSAPQQIGEDRDWRDIMAGHFNSFGLKSNGTLWAWGLGIPSARTNDVLTPTQVGTDSNWAAIAAGDYHLLALKTDGTIWLRGQNGSLAAPDYVTNSSPNMAQIGTDTNWSQIYSGHNGFIARKKDGSWWGCGDNNRGQLWLSGRQISKPTLISFPRELHPWAFDLGHNTALLLTPDGRLWSWGERVGSQQPGGLLKKIKMVVNRGAKALGLKTVFRNLDSPRRDEKPVRIWTLPESAR